MAEELLNRIEKLDNRIAIRVLEFFSARVFEGMETSPEELLEGIPEEYRSQVPFERALQMSSSERAQPLPERESAILARELLVGFAEDDAFAPSLSQALDEYQDNTLMAGEILATGVAISMIIIAATTTFKGKVGAFDVAKEVASPELIKSILKYFPKLI